MSPASPLVALIVMVASLGGVEPHGALIDPPARNYLYHTGLFPDQPPQWNYYAMECGGNNPQPEDVSNCGMCGDHLSLPTPREYEHGGYYGKGYIGKNYTAGSVINIETGFAAAHYGYFEMHLCSSAQETPACFQKLIILSASENVRVDNRVCVPYGNDQHRTITARVQLPAGVRCDRCTLRWTYRTSYPGWSGWSECSVNPNPAQVFRNCADIRIN